MVREKITDKDFFLFHLVFLLLFFFLETTFLCDSEGSE